MPKPFTLRFPGLVLIAIDRPRTRRREDPKWADHLRLNGSQALRQCPATRGSCSRFALAHLRGLVSR
jgi:hypothetical protein